MTSPVRRAENGCLLDVRLTPGASRSGAGSVYIDANGRPRLKIRVTAIPEKGKANAALIKLLAKSLKKGKTEFEIVAGKQDRDKSVLIIGDPGLVSPEIEDWLRNL